MTQPNEREVRIRYHGTTHTVHATEGAVLLTFRDEDGAVIAEIALTPTAANDIADDLMAGRVFAEGEQGGYGRRP